MVKECLSRIAGRKVDGKVVMIRINKTDAIIRLTD